MSLWLLAVLAGLLAAIAQYGRGMRTARAVWLPASLRAIALTLLLALLLDAPVGRAAPLPVWVALDVSASWLRDDDSSAWRAARAAVARAHPDTLLLFGDSLRLSGGAGVPALPGDLASRVRPAVERALGRGQPLVVVTDGEIDDPDALRDLPAGSRVIVVPRPPARDLAVASLELPRALVAGDTTELRVGLVAGAAGAAAGTLTLSVDGRILTRQSLEPLAPFAERTLILHAPLQGANGPAIVRAVVATSGDVEPRNDTLAIGVDISRAASAVFVSTSPDEDARYALSVLRGALAVPARGYLRVAAGVWRVEGSLAPVAESEVRRDLQDAPVAILHGDTALFGMPRRATAGPIALLVPATADQGEWYAADAPASPLLGTLGSLPWDSLPPITVTAAPPTGQWTALEARRGRESLKRAVITGSDTPRRVVVVAGSGWWRWRFHGGAAADAFTAMWGSIFDWLAAERADRRAAVPDGAVLRAGQPVRWRRGAVGDTVVQVTLRRLDRSK
ncbi:MAG TPA: hypothetical protein VJU87_10630, partial [Gemmatimonadaceae bacterium]|nr:hypothetical protein [Gemmatimonadaceae bacterium]